MVKLTKNNEKTHKNNVKIHENNEKSPKNQEKMLGQYKSYLIQPSKTINKNTKN